MARSGSLLILCCVCCVVVGVCAIQNRVSSHDPTLSSSEVEIAAAPAADAEEEVEEVEDASDDNDTSTEENVEGMEKKKKKKNQLGQFQVVYNHKKMFQWRFLDPMGTLLLLSTSHDSLHQVQATIRACRESGEVPDMITLRESESSPKWFGFDLVVAKSGVIAVSQSFSSMGDRQFALEEVRKYVRDAPVAYFVDLGAPYVEFVRINGFDHFRVHSRNGRIVLVSNSVKDGRKAYEKCKSLISSDYNIKMSNLEGVGVSFEVKYPDTLRPLAFSTWYGSESSATRAKNAVRKILEGDVNIENREGEKLGTMKPPPKHFGATHLDLLPEQDLLRIPEDGYTLPPLHHEDNGDVHGNE